MGVCTNRLPAKEIVDALQLLGKERLVLAIHDASFPAASGEDIGRGSPYGSGGTDFIRFARGLGFNGIQFGPQGQTSRDDPSPYDGTQFSRNILSIDWATVAADSLFSGLLDPIQLQQMVAGNPNPDGRHTAYLYAYDACHEALASMYANQKSTGWKNRRRTGGLLRSKQEWLFPDALYHARG